LRRLNTWRPFVRAFHDDAEEESITDINVTPLVDVMLVLLVIFMVTASLMLTSAIPVRLPVSGSGGVAHRAALLVVLRQDGRWMAEGKPATREEMVSRVRAAVARFPGIRVDLAADTRLSYGEIIAALDLLKQQGVRQVALSTGSR